MLPFARDLVNAALQRGEQALTQLQAGSSILPRRSDSGGIDARSVPVAASPGQPVEARVQRFRLELNASCINVHALKRLAMSGVPDKEGLRAVTWKVGRSVEAIAVL
jgi:hypothetical protein